MKTTVIHHSADFDGIFCREIARKFLPDAELIGWDFGDPPVPMPTGTFYVLDLPPDCVEGLVACGSLVFPEAQRLIWLDHHKSSIEKHRGDIPGHRIDGVAACRLTWQWFTNTDGCSLPQLVDYKNRQVEEPYAVRLAGEYDIWDKRDPCAELFQHGLRSEPLTWDRMWDTDENPNENTYVAHLLYNGRCLQYAQTEQNASIIKSIGFDLEWEGLKFLACNHARYNSHLFTAGLRPDHDACFGFKWTGKDWSISLYHAPGKEHHDLSLIAVKHGGGGHRGACGFTTKTLPFAT